MSRTSHFSREIKYYHYKRALEVGYPELHEIEKCLPNFLFILCIFSGIDNSFAYIFEQFVLEQRHIMSVQSGNNHRRNVVESDARFERDAF